jgi:hypothetical protein
MYDNSMKTNLDSDKYVCHTCGPSNNKRQGYEACPVVLLLSCCAGESPLGILLALVSCAGLGLGLVFVVRLTGPDHKTISIFSSDRTETFIEQVFINKLT